MPLSPGTRLGPYEILAPLGSGGMGDVYKARDSRLDRLVAIKISQEKFSERFDREARAVAALSHPNICALYDVGPDYLVMEFVEGSPLRPVGSARTLLDLAAQIADGLQAAHAAGILHRDLKPDNILVTKDGRVKILDFGLAKSVGVMRSDDVTGTMSVTQPGTTVGTVAYMSPEQARGSQALGVQSDQFSFGLILYELAAGQRAFRRASPVETMMAIIREETEPLPLSSPAPLRWIIERCLAKEPEQRYDSTRDLYRELRQIRERFSETTTVVPAAAGAPPVSRRRIPAWVWAPLLLIAGFLVAALWPGPPASLPRALPFATHAGIATMPAWSPKGDRLAYAADVEGVFQIFTNKPGASVPTQLTHQDASCFRPFWSVDGTRVYYIVHPSGQLADLWSISVAGGQPEKTLAGVREAALSPDGKIMAVLQTGAGGLYGLAFAKPPSAPPTPFSKAPISALQGQLGAAMDIKFTPDGRFLGFYTTASGKSEFWKIPMDGGDPVEMLRGRDLAQNGAFFAWLPDSRGIISAREAEQADDAARLRLWDFRAGTEHPLTEGAGVDSYPALSSVGRLAFSTGVVGYDILNMPLDGSAPREVIATSRSELGPDWASDGVRFAYSTDRSGAAEIWLRNQRDGSERLIVGQKDFPGGAGQLYDCAMSPDGARVAYRRVNRGSFEIWISPLSGEAPVRLWNDSAPQRGPSWSPDGNFIAYYSTRDGRTAVLKAQVGSNRPPDLIAYDDSKPVRWSPRGDWIAFNDGTGLRIVSPDRKQNRLLNARQWYTYGWSRDGAALYGITSNEKRHLALVRVEVAASRETLVADLGPVPAAVEYGDFLGEFPYRGFSLHPGGKSFLTSVFRIKTDLWLLEDFDRRTRLFDSLFHRGRQ